MTGLPFRSPGPIIFKTIDRNSNERLRRFMVKVKEFSWILPLLLAKACAVKAIWAAADVRFGSMLSKNGGLSGLSSLGVL